MTERSIQLALWWSVRSGARCALPNWTPPGWFECDLAVVTGAGFLTEYEIKLSAADLVADRRKVDVISRFVRGELPGRAKRLDRRAFKHDRMRQSDTRGPARYYMVVPEELTTHPAIPEWAGIVKARGFGNRASVSVIRQPKRLHSHGADYRILSLMRRSAYYRMWDMIQSGSPIVQEVSA